MEKLILTLLTPNRQFIVDQKVSMIRVTAHRGELTILPGHTPLMTTLVPGSFMYEMDGKLEKSQLSWGYLEVLYNKVNVLAEEAN